LLALMSLIGCSPSEISDRSSGVKIHLPDGWSRFDVDDLPGSEALKAQFIAYAGDASRKASVAVRKFPFRVASLPVAGSALARLKPEDLDRVFVGIEERVAQDLADGMQYSVMKTRRHGGASGRGYYVQISAEQREPGQPNRWVRSTVLFPKGMDEAIEVRIALPLQERSAYREALAVIDEGILNWIVGD
jgi:hypothetical protein